jgi:hypothetical protein
MWAIEAQVTQDQTIFPRVRMVQTRTYKAPILAGRSVGVQRKNWLQNCLFILIARCL